MRILMTGLGHGHNVRKFFDFFQRRPGEYHLSYCYTSRPRHYSLSQFSTIRFIPGLSVLNFFLELRKKNDLIWVHNWTPWPLLLFILLFRKRSSFLLYNVWSEPIPRLARTNTFKGRLYRRFFKACDRVQCNWYGTKAILDPIKGVDPVVVPWGLNEEYFEDRMEIGEEARAFIDNLPKGVTKFFFPKSISRASDHRLVVEAARELKEGGFKEFKVWFWIANEVNEELREELDERIRSLEVQDHVVFHEHSFLPVSDMIAIWEEMDCGLQMAVMDQLSSSFLEPLFFRRELIVTDIPPYRKFEEVFGLDLRLIPRDREVLAGRMKEVMLGGGTSKEEMEERSAVVRDHFRFEKNLEKTLEELSKN